MKDNFGIYAGEYDRVYVIGQDIYTFYDYNIPVNVKIPPEIKR
jgi:hypothetical protein